MFNWGGTLVRISIAGAFLLASTLLWFFDYFWPWGWAVGAVLLLFAFPNNAEKKGYHDF